MDIGKYTYGDPELRWPNATYSCGKFCSIAQGVKIYLGNGSGHDVNFVSTYPFEYVYPHIFTNAHNKSKDTNGNVVIGNDVWIGDNVTIMSGITVGDGAVIAANSHVIKNVEPYSIVGGNPAKLIKYRFTQEQITKLLEIKWWDWQEEKINMNLHLICSSNIDEFIESACLPD